jgi:CBS domain-containing membrane protein
MSKTLVVKDLMSRRVVSVRPEDSIAKVRLIMDEKNVRHVPVVDAAQNVVGLVSDRDLLRHALEDQLDLPVNVLEDVLRKSRAEDVMTREVATVEADEPLSSAADTMLENKYGCLPVVDGTRLVGILTESDFVRHLAGGG